MVGGAAGVPCATSASIRRSLPRPGCRVSVPLRFGRADGLVVAALGVGHVPAGMVSGWAGGRDDSQVAARP